jgi:thymidylate synthase
LILLRENSIDLLWEASLRKLMNGTRVLPRGIPCYEITDAKLVLTHATNNLLVNEVRKLSPRFAVAEWLWIFFGHQDVATISRYSNRIKQFSDDGVSFNGTYGIPIVAQWDHTVNTLKKDPFSRQAVISIFRFTDMSVEYPIAQRWESKDIPCTLSLQYLLRDDFVDCIATMRSSDVWLGLPYDVFNFSMLQNIMAAELGAKIGQLSLNLGSFHLYESNAEKAAIVLSPHTARTTHIYSAPLTTRPPIYIDDALRAGPSSEMTPWPQTTEWTRYDGALRSKTDEEALAWLRG